MYTEESAESGPRNGLYHYIEYLMHFTNKVLCIYFGPPQAKELNSLNDSGWLE